LQTCANCKSQSPDTADTCRKCGRDLRVESLTSRALVRMQVASPKASQKEKLGIEDEQAFWKLVQAAFAQKRKTLVNNWKARCDPERLRAALKDLGIDLRARAETLSLAEFAALFKALRSGSRAPT